MSRRLAVFVVVPIAVLALIGVATLWPGGSKTIVQDPSAGFITDDQLVEADVISVEARPCGAEIDPTGNAICDDVTASLVETGKEISFSIPVSATSVAVGAGERVVLIESLFDEFGAPDYAYFDHVRRSPVYLLAAIFALVVIAFGRWKGLGALAGLAFTLVMVVWFVVPAIVDGKSPVAVAIVAAALMMIVTLYLAHGPGMQTVVALLGTLAALVLTALLSWLWIEISHISGLATEEAVLVNLGTSGIDLVGLVLAGIIIGSLGVLDDVTVTQAAAIRELRLANPDLAPRSLAARGIRIGRDHVASTVNTLVLAYVGASLPLFLLFQVGEAGFGRVVNGELIVVEVVRALVGSLGIVAAVPITTALAVWLMKGADANSAQNEPPQTLVTPAARGNTEADN